MFGDIGVADRMRSKMRSVWPRAVSQINIHPVLNRKRYSYNLAARDECVFIVDSLQLNEQDHMKAIHLSSNNFIDSGDNCRVCQCQMTALLRVVGKNGSVGLAKSVCPSCTHIQFTRLPNEEWYSNYFSSKFYADEMERRRIPSADTIIYDDVKKYINNGLPVFDIGCGFGEKLIPFKDRGFSVVGVEPSKHRANIARNMLGDNIYCLAAEDSLNNTNVAGNAPFGLCSFYHVLEFCFDPHALLKDMHALMANNAVLYIATGLFNTRNIMQESHFSLIRSTFNQYSLQLLLQCVGFEILDTRVTNKETTLRVIARRRSSVQTKVIDIAQKELQQAIIQRHIRSELGLACSSTAYDLTTKWSRGSRKAVLKRIPTNKNNDMSICFVHKNTNPVMIVK